ncbi:Coatomer subunit beta [Melipona quadrifasciata]|uniref:Coatomer subunit beta n=1 Tax=Melipona quadrifasciata TaxID=166423 RepID=A0A0M8ZVW4_9HYME|nr:Coatomer subunit beta [Melipona quadrifasciata]
MGTVAEQPCYTLINVPTDTEPLNELQLKQDLEKGDVQTKIEALKKTIHMILSGERLPGLLMTIIRFVLPLQDHTIKKLLLIFWEIVPKTSPDGKLLQEMILVCDAYRKDLQHPNEFVRGSTLRFLCKLKEPELLEPLMPAIIACLEHRHSYVRRNAVLAIFTIYRNFEFLIPDAPELIAKYLEGEQDMSCRRNAFLMLLHADQSRALAYLAACLDQVPSFGDILQLVCLANPSERARFIRCIYSLLNSPSAAVRYEAAGTLVTLSNAPTAIKAAASCYIELVVKESDNNVKLIVLDRLIAMKDSPVYERVLQDLVMDVLRVLGSPALEVRTKTLALAMDLVTTRTIEEMVQLLKKEVLRTAGGEHEDAGRYRQLLVRTLHACSIKFSDVAATVIPVLTDFLSENNEAAATDVLVFVREAIQRFENLRPLIVEKLLEAGAKEKPGSVVQVDDAIQFLQLSRGSDLTGGAGDVFEQSLSAAVAGRPGAGGDAPAPSALSKVTQLTGFSDPVYAEALVHVNQYDIVLDVLIVNQTEDTLQNCTLELATMGDLKLVERPQPIVLAPRDFASIKANVKVASTENGIIFGNIVYDVSGAGSDRSVVVLNDIHIDIMDYIVPATCTDLEFRQMWAEFEWENKVSVNTTLSDLREYLAHLLKSTNMRCLTPEKALSGQCGFMAANMYAKSIFGEDALANMSIEKPLNKPDAPVVGHIRIRAKSQGMALSLGDKISSTQKGPQSKVVQAA